MELSLSLLVAATSVLLLILFLKHHYATLHESIWRPLPYPPGPKPVPLLGNLYDMPNTNSWITFAEWRKLYGDLIHLYIPGGGHILIINSEEIAIELLEKRAALYSDRGLSSFDEICGVDFNLVMMPYSERWRKNRKTFHQSLKYGAESHFEPIQRRKVHALLTDLLNTPEDFMEHIMTFTQGIMFSGMYGLEGSSQDHHAQLAKSVLHVFEEVLTPGNFVLPKLFPFLCYLPSWMPGCQFKHFAKESRKVIEEMRNVLFDMSIKQTEDTGVLSLVAELVAKNQGNPSEISQIKDMAAASYIAALETMSSTISTFILAMTLNPSVQARAQEEIDLIVGSGRLPDFGDRHSLPYVEAVYREVMRWNPAGPLGIPHKTSKSDIYNGYYIPKGTTVITNIWGMNHNPAIYDNPDAFKPERFLTGSPDAPFTGINNILAFGFGRRVCVGRYVADATVWLAMVCILATLSIAKAKDEHGNEIEVPIHQTNQFIFRPEPFCCSITPRSAREELLIKAT